MGELIIAGERFEVAAKVVTWHDSGLDATAPHCVATGTSSIAGCTGPGAFDPDAKNKGALRYGWRPRLKSYQRHGMPPLAAVREVINQFVLHHDGMYSSRSCFHVLHNQRGLSCHFLIDNNGTIYQTLDLALMAFHAAGANATSIGVELCNRGDAGKYADYYDDVTKYPDRRITIPIQIHGSKILAWDFTGPQKTSMRELALDLARLLPNLPIEYPQTAPGVPARTVMAGASGFKGYLGHYHLTGRKWDPGPFDFKDFCDGLRGRRSFPVWPPGRPVVEGAPPEIPAKLDELRAQTTALIDANEQHGGGFFPVGPWGETRLWHGGLHLPGPAKAPVYAPLAGRVVAARMGKDSPSGSVNFVLLRHDMSLGAAHLRFFSLYMHLHDELAETAPAPPWMSKASWRAAGQVGTTVLLDEPIEAGEVIGRIGTAGPRSPEDLSAPQIHFEIFANEAIQPIDDEPTWRSVDGYNGGRFCDATDINDLIDNEPADGALSRRELVSFFAGSGDRLALRQLVTHHVTEWSATPSWNQALRMQPDYRDVSGDEIDAQIAEQIEPGLWWSDAVALHAGLPRDGLVRHYHPLSFLRWMNEAILEAAANPANLPPAVQRGQTSIVTDMTDDRDEVGDAAVTTADYDQRTDDDTIQLDNLAEGYLGEP